LNGRTGGDRRRKLFYVRRERRRFSVGAIPTRPLSLRPVALEAVEGGNDFD